MYCDIIFILWSMFSAHFNYVDFINLFEDFNELNITVIVKIRAVATSWSLVIWAYFYLDIPSQNSYVRYKSWCS